QSFPTRRSSDLVPHLAEGVFEAVLFSQFGQLDVVLEAVIRALFDGAGDETTADVGNPVGELQRFVRGIVDHAGTPREMRNENQGCSSRRRGSAAGFSNTVGRPR